MTIICPPPSAQHLPAEWWIPHPGVGYTELYRNGDLVWQDLHGDTNLTVSDLTEWCDLAGDWILRSYGPMVDEAWRLDVATWRLGFVGVGFA